MSLNDQESSSIRLAELPPHWAWATVEDLGVCGDQAVLTGPFGTSMGSSDFVPDAEGNVPVLTIGCLQEAGLDRRKAVFVRPGKAKTLEKYRLRHGDLLFSRMATVGRAGLVERGFEGVLFNYHLMRLRLEPELIDPYFFVYFVRGSRTVTDFVRSVNHGMTRDGINTQQLLAMPVPVAPRRQQHRIVEAIESYFTQLDDAVATLERVQRNLKRYRASVLKAAVEGRLVSTEAELARAESRDYEPAPVLLERILAERRRRWKESGRRGQYTEPIAPDTSDLPELPNGWCWATMDHFVVGIEAGRNFKCVETPPGPDEVGVVKVSAVTWGTFDEEESKTCPRSELVNEAHLIWPGDFLISRANTIELVGACVIVGAIQRRLMLSDKILRLRTVGGLDWWLLWVLRSTLGRREIESLATGNQESMRNIGQEGIHRIRVPVPPEAECRRLITEIEQQMSVFEHSATGVRHSEQRCRRLRQAILRWAFEGRLADQDPSDEPASALLERIRSQTLVSRLSAGDTGDRRPQRGGRRRSARAENKP